MMKARIITYDEVKFYLRIMPWINNHTGRPCGIVGKKEDGDNIVMLYTYHVQW